MNLMRLLAERVDREGAVRVGVIGAGKFGSMFLSQVPTMPGLEVAAIADSTRRGRAAPAAPSAGTRRGLRGTHFSDDGADAVRRRTSKS